MRVLVIGATGTIGKAVVQALEEKRHEVLQSARSGGQHRADITSLESLEKLFQSAGPLDAVVCAAGGAAFKPLPQLSDADFQHSLSYKLMGQVNVIRAGLSHVRDGGSITVTSGVLARSPMPGSAAVSLVNAGLEGFTRAAALEAPRGIRVNVVSPPWVTETLEAMNMKGIPGALPASRVALAYVESVEGKRNGEVIEPRSAG